jgi:hypothetical protein
MAPNRDWELPPLILHPFSTGSGPADVLESSRAALMLAGIIPDGDSSEDALTRKMLKGRHEEIRMLCFIGKDLHRWLDQCMDFAARQPQLASRSLQAQSFADLLVNGCPAAVVRKLRGWGVDDYRNIFARAIGLAAVFAGPPERAAVQSGFLLHYHRFADTMYDVFLRFQRWPAITEGEFAFSIYSSGEYARMLESEWSEPPAL